MIVKSEKAAVFVYIFEITYRLSNIMSVRSLKFCGLKFAVLTIATT